MKCQIPAMKDGKVLYPVCRLRRGIVSQAACTRCTQSTTGTPQEPSARTLRPDLVRLLDTLPPHKEGRDRPLHFEPDGTIVYEREEGEPPRDINGYQRDPDNPLRFTPLWPDCRLRHPTAVRFANCGCIDVIMRCNNPALPRFADRVKHTTCQECPQRKAL
jgi:hypothetical protein